MSKKSNQKVADAIIKKLGKKGVEYFLKHGEIPAIKLTKEEMDVVKGGIIGDDGCTKTLQDLIKKKGDFIF